MCYTPPDCVCKQVPNTSKYMRYFLPSVSASFVALFMLGSRCVPAEEVRSDPSPSAVSCGGRRYMCMRFFVSPCLLSAPSFRSGLSVASLYLAFVRHTSTGLPGDKTAPPSDRPLCRTNQSELRKKTARTCCCREIEVKISQSLCIFSGCFFSHRPLVLLPERKTPTKQNNSACVPSYQARGPTVRHAVGR